jgi:predicted DNA-binding WGR domain protein
MKKLYLYDDKKKCYFYDEAWVAGNIITRHFGKLGTKGKTETHRLNRTLSEEENIDRVLESAVKKGYKEIPLEDHAVLLIEYSVNGFGSSQDLSKRHALQDRMDETLGWTGLGHCDGGSIGSGTMEVCCLVVDFQLARDIIVKDLKGSEFNNYTRIYDEGALS